MRELLKKPTQPGLSQGVGKHGAAPQGTDARSAVCIRRLSRQALSEDAFLHLRVKSNPSGVGVIPLRLPRPSSATSFSPGGVFFQDLLSCSPQILLHPLLHMQRHVRMERRLRALLSGLWRVHASMRACACMCVRVLARVIQQQPASPRGKIGPRRRHQALDPPPHPFPTSAFLSY